MVKLLKFSTWLVICFLCSSCYMRDLNLREGIHSFQVQDYRQAFVRLKPEAQKGQPDAQYAIGYMYYYGQGVIENRRQAWYWITKAAEAGQSDAQAAVRILGGKH
jgi:TPR repeat protein